MKNIDLVPSDNVQGRYYLYGGAADALAMLEVGDNGQVSIYVKETGISAIHVVGSLSSERE